MYQSAHSIISSLLVLLLTLTTALPLTDDSRHAKRSVAGPVITANFPDPGLMKVGDTWYAFATRTKGTTIHIQVASSPDFETWTVINEDALPTLPAWIYQPSWNTWAPDVKQLDDGSFIMYYSASTAEDTSKHCVGVASASTVEGPYTGQDKALICPISQGGAIDASGFRDASGARYIVYKIDGNAIGSGGACGNTIAPIQATPLVLQPVASDGYTLQGTATTLLDNIGVSDDGVIEAPTLIRSQEGIYFLFFSSGCFVTSSYTISYATSSSLRGPYTRAAAPLMQTGDGHGLIAPGGMDIWSDNQHMIFHANNAAGRSMYTALINLSGTTVTV
ncbi:hypothetical protein AAFC00_003478 [Neodothiora populina]|uniref:Glycoside hydrolase family 43 protein n=1 Tax=Neodothiora populina TaxID=2781224 RepID=A0ABR3PEB6_9PEZI